MENWILRVGKNFDHFEDAQKVWLKYHIFMKTVASMPEALKLMTKNEFLLVVIVADGIKYLPHLKLMRDMKPTPILVLAATYDASEKIEAIRLGADEYIADPPNVEEGIASGLALIRRYAIINQRVDSPLTIITYQEIFICVEYRKLFLKSVELELTRKEFDLLHLLFSNAGRVFSHQQIYKYVWADDSDEVSENYAVWCLLARVRKKLRSVLNTFDYIKTVRDVGYCIKTPHINRRLNK